jgi:hypothetical protein
LGKTINPSRVAPHPLTCIELSFLFLKAYISSNHFDSNSNLNYE